MDSPRKPSRRLVSILAFLQRAYILRPLGKLGRWGEDTEQRASAWLDILANPSQDLSFLVKIENLTQQYDLFREEEAMNESCLQLQIRAFDLAPQFESLSDLLEEQCGKAPIAKVISALIRQATIDGMDEILIDLDSNQIPPDGTKAERIIEVSFRYQEEWKLAMTIPSNLASPIYGFTVRMLAVSYARMRPFMWHCNQMPEHVEINTLQAGKITFTIVESRQLSR